MKREQAIERGYDFTGVYSSNKEEVMSHVRCYIGGEK